MRARFAGFAFALAIIAGAASAQPAPDPALEGRLKRLESELRCLVCQNQTLADSNAPLAEDLRREVRELAVSGKSDDDIRAFLVARYGDFVLYEPPVKATTWLLWFGPFLLLAGGALVWLAIVRRRRAVAVAPSPATQESGDALARARALLDDNPLG
ncbi:MAG: cytochrome c-type biogenesis protein CcmH [Burkholderiales bacterium]|jgi:cytochrome c-type biogenesis protein CcmH|nr:cytochrome c-type biogenesis protein CcmH [Burkholderiales bacterium]